MKCLSQLKGLAAAVIYYADDNKDRMVAASYSVSGHPFYWPNNASAYGSGLGEYIHSYKQSENVNSGWFCPSNPYLTAPNRRYATDHSSSITTYAYNRNLQTVGSSNPGSSYWNKGDKNSTQYGWNSLSQVTSSHSKTGSLSDFTYYVRPDGEVYAVWEIRYTTDNGSIAVGPFVPPEGMANGANTYFGSPNGGATNVAFLDGHARTMKWDAVVSEYYGGVSPTTRPCLTAAP